MPEHDAPVESPSTMLVGIANPNTIPQLMTLAAHTASCAKCGILATHVVTVPSQMALGAARSSPEVAAAGDLLRQAVSAGAKAGVDVRGVVEVAREVDEGLTSAVAGHEADLLLVGYSDMEPGVDESEKAFDRIMHRVARSVAADLVVAKFRREGMRSVLVPIAGAPNLRLTGLLARAIAAGVGASVRFIHVVEPGANPQDEELRVSGMLAAHDLLDLGEFEVIRTASPAATIIAEADEHDVAIIGAEARPSLADAIFGNVAERVAGQASCTVLLVRAQQEK